MDTTTPIEHFNYPSYQDPAVNQTFQKAKTATGVDIISPCSFLNLYNKFENTGTYNIIDYQGISEFNMCEYTKHALMHLPKKENIIISYPTEALSSVYWNSVFYILQESGYKNILWIDGGLTGGELYRHIHHVKIAHVFSSYFFKTLFRTTIVENMPTPGNMRNRKKLFVCISRLARQERFYFTSKIIKDEALYKKGIVTCGWGDSTLKVYERERDNLKILLDEDVIDKFPLSLGHNDKDQHAFFDEFNSAIFNVVQESSIGYDQRTHGKVYNTVPTGWCTVNSDRLFFTEKSAKPFLSNQIPLFIAAPGYVETLRNLGFDLFDDIVDHSYDMEDNLFKRCDLVFNELKRISEMRTVEGWVRFLELKRIQKRFVKNHERMVEIHKEQDDKIFNWIRENF